MAKAFVGVMFILITGCATRNELTVVSTYGEMVDIPKATPTDLKPIEWKLLSYEGYVLYSLDDANMNVLLSNLDEFRRYIREQQEIVKYLTGLIELRREVKPGDQKVEDK